MAFLQGQGHHGIGADGSVQLGFETGVGAHFDQEGIQLGFRHGATGLVPPIPSHKTGLWQYSPNPDCQAKHSIAIRGSRVVSDSKISL